MRIYFTTVMMAAALAATACNRKDDDRLGDNDIAAASAGSARPGTDTRCTAASSHEAVKRELFRRAAEIRGSNAENYATIAGFALLVVDAAAPTAPVSAAEAVECRGRATLRLPPNLHVAGGRTGLTGTIGFSVGRAAPGAPPVVTLTDDQAITIPLATLTQRRATPPAPAPEAEPEPVAPIAPAAPSDLDARDAAVARPSFDCRQARTRSELAVCANPTLAGLDLTMSDRYRAALAAAGRGQAQLLRQTRDRFLGYRDRCSSDSCIANTYRGRMREIDDIMAGRWQAPRR